MNIHMASQAVRVAAFAGALLSAPLHAQTNDCRPPEEVDRLEQLALRDKSIASTWSPAWWTWVEHAASDGCDEGLRRLQHFLALNEKRLASDQDLRERYFRILTNVLEQGRLDDVWYRTLAGTLGQMHEYGKAGLTANAAEAQRWYMRAADRGGLLPLWNAVSLAKRQASQPADHRRAAELLDRYFREQRSFYATKPDEFLKALYSAADLGFSSAASRLTIVYAKGLLGVKANGDASERWQQYAQRAKWVETHDPATPPPRLATRLGQQDEQCEQDATAFMATLMAQQARDQRPGRETHTSHFNRALNLCLVSSVVQLDSPSSAIAQGLKIAAIRLLMVVSTGASLGRYESSESLRDPSLCSMQTVRLREGYEMQSAYCKSLTEYEKFAEWAMRE